MGIEQMTPKQLEGIFSTEGRNILSKLSKPVEKMPLLKDLLYVLAAVGVVSLAALMPGVAITVGRIVREREKYDLKRRLSWMKNKGYVTVRKNEKGEDVVEITQAGTKRALKYKFDDMVIKKSRRWDGKWRLVIFDVEETRRGLRDRFREKLGKLGFYRLNDSVFVHPYPCFDEIEFIRNYYFVGAEVTYILAEKIEDDVKLRRVFDLQ